MFVRVIIHKDDRNALTLAHSGLPNETVRKTTIKFSADQRRDMSRTNLARDY
jgi:hypothetical protein